MKLDKLDSDLLRYSAEHGHGPGDRLPALDDLSSKLGISVGKLREQLEGARMLGLVEVRPRTGIKLAPYSFTPAVRASLLFALAHQPQQFDKFSDLRNHIEFNYFYEAADKLTPADLKELQAIIESAKAKLQGKPILIPDIEHRELHLALFKRLDNPFVLGLLEAYWDAYEAVGLNVYADISYLTDVWCYHERIVEALVAHKHPEAYDLLVQHTKLLQQRER
ncbi:MAG: FCD domain-containing protein [Anaerolineae bacterium]|nr:FCD domain-containing protein [Anaerolineae bacterium]